MISTIFKSKNFYNLIILIFIINLFNLPENAYKLMNSKYKERLNDVYGYCFPQGYGFIKEIEQKYNLKNIQTLNFDDFAQSDFFLNDPSKKKLKNYLILINYDPIKNKDFLLDDYEVIIHKQNCLLLKK